MTDKTARLFHDRTGRLRHVVISDGLIYEIADKTFFCDLLAFLDSEGVLPPNVK